MTGLQRDGRLPPFSRDGLCRHVSDHHSSPAGDLMFMRQEKIPPADLFMFEMDKVKWALAELELLANRYREAVNKLEAAVEFNSLTCLRSACLDIGEIGPQTSSMATTLEIIVSKASRSTKS